MTIMKPEKPDFLKNNKAKLHFLYYVRNGVCRPNSEMPDSPYGFVGWLCASHVIRNQEQHKKEDIKASIKAFKEFLKDIPSKMKLAEEDLLKYI